MFLLLAGCGGHENQAPIYDGWQQPTARKSFHQVQAGETLYSIAWNYGYDYRDVASINKISSSGALQVGQRLYLPLKSEVDSHPENNALHKKSLNNGTKSRVSLSNDSKTEKKLRGEASQSWRWPVNGTIIKPFAPGGSLQNQNKGIDIAGVYGDKILASRGGEVVYSGDGLPGYGNLIIIKHDSDYLSAYAHSRKNLVKEGTKVNVDQPIAEMGSTGANRIMLHFEIRRAGKPVDPQRYLPART